MIPISGWLVGILTGLVFVPLIPSHRPTAVLGKPLELRLSPTVGFAPLKLQASVRVAQEVRGSICLHWDGEETGQSCWDQVDRQMPLYTISFTLKTPGEHKVWVAMEDYSLSTPTITVDVR